MSVTRQVLLGSGIWDAPQDADRRIKVLMSGMAFPIVPMNRYG